MRMAGERGNTSLHGRVSVCWQRLLPPMAVRLPGDCKSRARRGLAAPTLLVRSGSEQAPCRRCRSGRRQEAIHAIPDIVVAGAQSWAGRPARASGSWTAAGVRIRLAPVRAKSEGENIMRQKIALVLAGLALLAVPVTAVAFTARAPRIDRTVQLLDAGRKLRIGGPLSQAGGCVSGEPAAIRVTVTQRAVLAQGRWRGQCQSSTRRSPWSRTHTGHPGLTAPKGEGEGVRARHVPRPGRAGSVL